MTQREPHPAVATHSCAEAALGTRRPPCRNSRPPRGKGVFHYSTRNIAFIVGWNVQMYAKSPLFRMVYFQDLSA